MSHLVFDQTSISFLNKGDFLLPSRNKLRLDQWFSTWVLAWQNFGGTWIFKTLQTNVGGKIQGGSREEAFAEVFAKNSTSSVPQGSILSPLLFILYVNDFRNCLDFSTNVSFADDTNIFITGKNIQSVYSKTNLELKNIDEWMTANKLTVNSAKTKYLLFTPRKSNYSVSNTSFEVYFRSNTIEKVSSIRFLGVIINENLSWKEHMNMIKRKIRSSLGSIMRVKPCLTTKAMLILYNSLILSHLRYCITSWCYGNRTIINQLQRICNKFIRAMYGIKRRGCVKNVMIKNELLNIQQLYESEIAILIYKFQKRTFPIPI